MKTALVLVPSALLVVLAAVSAQDAADMASRVDTLRHRVSEVSDP